jgi:hypothetical protein
MGSRNRFQGINSASLCSLAGRYDNPLPLRFLAPIDSLKIPALEAVEIAENGEEAVLYWKHSVGEAISMITSDTRQFNYQEKAMNRKQKAAREAKLIQACPARGSSSATISLAEAVRSG